MLTTALDGLRFLFLLSDGDGAEGILLPEARLVGEVTLAVSARSLQGRATWSQKSSAGNAVDASSGLGALTALPTTTMSVPSSLKGSADIVLEARWGGPSQGKSEREGLPGGERV